jgi:hemerythrin superfamily protein
MAARLARRLLNLALAINPGGAEDAMSSARNEGILDLIQSDHELAVALFERLRELVDPDERRAVFAALRVAVEAHGAAEEETLYAALRMFEGAEDLVAGAAAAHEELVDGFDDISAAGTEDPAWADMLASLRERFDAHVSQEETELFDLARERFDQARLLQLEREMLAIKGDLQGSGHSAVQ